MLRSGSFFRVIYVSLSACFGIAQFAFFLLSFWLNKYSSFSAGKQVPHAQTFRAVAHRLDHVSGKLEPASQDQLMVQAQWSPAFIIWPVFPRGASSVNDGAVPTFSVDHGDVHHHSCEFLLVVIFASPTQTTTWTVKYNVHVLVFLVVPLDCAR